MKENEPDLEEAVMTIVSGNKDIKIIMDRTEVLKEVSTITIAVAMLFGQTYTLNLKYPPEKRKKKNLQSTLELCRKY